MASSSEGSFVQPEIPKFDGYYDHWAMLRENFLHSKDYWQFFENEITVEVEGIVLTETQRKTIEQEKLKDLKVKNYLFQAIDRSIMDTILNKDTAKNIWDSMKQKFQGSTKITRANLQALRREFEVLQMKEGEKVNEYFALTLTIANEKKIHGEVMKQVVIIEKILRSVTTKFDYVVVEHYVQPEEPTTTPVGPPDRDAVTIGEALEVIALSAGDMPIDQSDAAAIQVAEARAKGQETTLGGVGAKAQSAATANLSTMGYEQKTKLSDVLADATTALTDGKPVTGQAAERVIGVELRNKPNMSTIPGGVASTIAAAAGLNQQNK